MNLYFMRKALPYLFGTVIAFTSIHVSAEKDQHAQHPTLTGASIAAEHVPRIDSSIYNSTTLDSQTIDSQTIDQITAKALNAIAQNELDAARALLRNLVNQYPDYHLGQLLLGELHAASISTTSALSTSRFDRSLMQLLLEAQARQNNGSHLLAPTDKHARKPSDILKIGTGLDFWIQVDLQHGTQTVYEVDGDAFIPHWRQYVGYGAGGFGKTREGDLKTPLGVYRINGYRDDASLPELYGSGALMLDYPNAADKIQQRTGSGIWLHGVPRLSRSRGPLSSEGCVTMGNDYVSALINLVDPAKTLVALSAQTVLNAHTVELADIEHVFDEWINEQSQKSEASHLLPQWNDVTVTLSSAGALDSEVQEVALYFPAIARTENFVGDGQPIVGFTALFLKRAAPGSREWELAADETSRTGT